MISYFFQRESTKRNIRQLLKFMFVLTVMVTVYSVIFHFLMAFEGKDHSWVTGFYWTLTVMSTLGFGDITFHSDLGRALFHRGAAVRDDLSAHPAALHLHQVLLCPLDRGRVEKADAAGTAAGDAGAT